LWDCVMHPSPPGASLYSGEGCPDPSTKATKGGGKGRSRAAARVGVGPSRPPPTPKTLALANWVLGLWRPSPYPIRESPRV
jgi:hypothetical protein